VLPEVITVKLLGGTDERYSREAIAAAQKWALSSVTPDLFGLVRESLDLSNVKDSGIAVLALDDHAWRNTGMQSVFDCAGISRSQVVTKPARALAQMAKWLKRPEATPLVIEAVLNLLARRDTGQAGVPPADTFTNGTTILSTLVNERTGDYRTGHFLPGIHWGSCQCCSGAGYLKLFKELGTLKATDKGQMRDILQEIFKGSKKGFEHSTILAELVTQSDPSVEASLLHVLDSGGTPTLMRYHLGRRMMGKKQAWQLKAVCIECVRNFQNPKVAAREAHTFKLLAKVRHEAISASRHVNDALGKLKKLKARTAAEQKNAKAHLENAKRVVDLHSKGRSVQQRSTNFTRADEDALAREAFRKGLGEHVIKANSKSGLWKIKGPRKGKGRKSVVSRDRVQAIEALIDTSKVMEELAAVDFDVNTMWDDGPSVGEEE
jgi:hypothetical protein